MKKQVKVSVEPWLFNYMKSTLDVEFIFNVPQNFQLVRTSPEAGYKYFFVNRKEAKVDLYMIRPTLKRTYGVILRIKENMKERMLSQALIDAKSGLHVWPSLDFTLRAWGIHEKEYARDRAYKQWQRSQQYIDYKKWCHLQETENKRDLVLLK